MVHLKEFSPNKGFHSQNIKFVIPQVEEFQVELFLEQKPLKLIIKIPFYFASFSPIVRHIPRPNLQHDKNLKKTSVHQDQSSFECIKTNKHPKTTPKLQQLPTKPFFSLSALMPLLNLNSQLIHHASTSSRYHQIH